MTRPNFVQMNVMIALVATCLSSHATAAEPLKVFGRTAAGEDVQLFALENDHGMVARFISLGATLVRLKAPDRDGNLADVVLGFDDVAGYQSDRNQSFGCIVGRVANRIAKGKFELDGKTYHLAINNGPNHLHGGGSRALARVPWQGKAIDTKLGPGVVFTYTSPDGEEGYPGTVEFTVTYVLTNQNELRMTFEAKTDQATPVNLSQHTYFNLAGHGAKTALDHQLTLHADQYTPTDETLIPTGEIAKVAGTPLDFRPQADGSTAGSKQPQARTIGSRIAKLLDTPAGGYDHNFVLNKPKAGELTKAAVLRHEASGRTLTVHTTQPGVQFYTGNFLFGQQGKDGQTYAKQSGVCLETQHFPDSVNHANFPSVIVTPEKPYRETCVYTFTAE